ncbi:MAG: hypothetical protein LRY76_06595 [Alphaproteobacteria bacterium]|nr:hypothetical protein [Alphaproteobacteria bacterium]MCD8571175.1 hypothetical protein [Alphaproteobacteria bacterium]
MATGIKYILAALFTSAGILAADAEPAAKADTPRIDLYKKQISPEQFTGSPHGFRVPGKGVLLYLEESRIPNSIMYNSWAFCPDSRVTETSPINTRQLPLCYQMSEGSSGRTESLAKGITALSATINIADSEEAYLEGDPREKMDLQCPAGSASLPALTKEEMGEINLALKNGRMTVMELPDVYKSPSALLLPDGRILITSVSDTNRSESDNISYKSRSIVIDPKNPDASPQDAVTDYIAPDNYKYLDNKGGIIFPEGKWGYLFTDPQNGQKYALAQEYAEEGLSVYKYFLDDSNHSWHKLEGQYVKELPDENLKITLEKMGINQFKAPRLATPCDNYDPFIY